MTGTLGSFGAGFRWTGWRGAGAGREGARCTTGAWRFGTVGVRLTGLVGVVETGAGEGAAATCLTWCLCLR